MKKNTLYLWAEIVFEERIQILFMMILVIVITFASSLAITSFLRYSSVISGAHMMKLDDKYFCQASFNFNLMSDDERKDTIERIRSLECVDDCICTGFFNGSGVQLKQSATIPGTLDNSDYECVFVAASLTCDSESPEEIFPVVTTDGRFVTSLLPNHILLDEAASSVFTKGETFSFLTMVNTDDGIEYSEYELTVDGFVDGKSLMFDDTNSLNDLSQLLQPIYNLKDTAVDRVVDGDKGCYYILASILDNGIHRLNFNETSPSLLILSVRDGYSGEDLENALSEEGLTTESYSALEKAYKEEYSNEMRSSLIMLSVSAILIIGTLSGCFINWYSSKKKELVIYTLLGATWNESIMLSITPYLFSICIGVALGSLMSRLKALFIDYDSSEILSVGWYFMIFALCILVYGLTSLIYLLIYRKQSPVELYKAKD